MRIFFIGCNMFLMATCYGMQDGANGTQTTTTSATVPIAIQSLPRFSAYAAPKTPSLGVPHMHYLFGGSPVEGSYGLGSFVIQGNLSEPSATTTMSRR